MPNEFTLVFFLFIRGRNIFITLVRILEYFDCPLAVVPHFYKVKTVAQWLQHG